MDSPKRNRNRAFLLATAGLIGIVLVFTVKPHRMQTFKESGVVWNTVYNITYLATTDLSDSIAAQLRTVELSVSPFNKASRITAINGNRTDTLDRYLVTLYNRSREICQESGGAFDPTVSPLVNAWGFGYKKETSPPDLHTVDSLLQFVGIGKTSLSGCILKKSDPRISFNFSAIAKGLGCDEIGRMLERNGVEDYMVEIGGEIAVKGKNPKGKTWHVSIDKPIASESGVEHKAAEIIAVSDCGIATSGNYRNFSTDSAGRRFAHTISPTSGMPVQSDILSATVVAPDCMTADAYATTFMVLGSEQSKKLLERHPELAAMFITAGENGKFRLWHSPAFKRMLAAQ